jgi:hypothetical protein
VAVRGRPTRSASWAKTAGSGPPAPEHTSTIRVDLERRSGPSSTSQTVSRRLLVSGEERAERKWPLSDRAGRTETSADPPIRKDASDACCSSLYCGCRSKGLAAKKSTLGGVRRPAVVRRRTPLPELVRVSLVKMSSTVNKWPRPASGKPARPGCKSRPDQHGRAAYRLGGKRRRLSWVPICQRSFLFFVLNAYSRPNCCGPLKSPAPPS